MKRVVKKAGLRVLPDLPDAVRLAAAVPGIGAPPRHLSCVEKRLFLALGKRLATLRPLNVFDRMTLAALCVVRTRLVEDSKLVAAYRHKPCLGYYERKSLRLSEEMRAASLTQCWKLAAYLGWVEFLGPQQ